MPDFDAITTALVARYAAAQVTPPAGYTNIRLSTGDVPAKMPALPCIFIFPSEGAFDHFPSGRTGAQRFRLQFFYSRAVDLRRDATGLRKWLTVLVDQLKLSVKLAGLVSVIHVMAWRIVILSYAGEDYSGIELDIDCETEDAWVAVA